MFYYLILLICIACLLDSPVLTWMASLGVWHVKALIAAVALPRGQTVVGDFSRKFQVQRAILTHEACIVPQKNKSLNLILNQCATSLETTTFHFLSCGRFL